MGSLYATPAVPAPSVVPPLAGARVPNVSLHVPGFVLAYRNQPVAASPRGFALPLSVAPVLVTEDAAAVVTAGAASVVKVSSAPNVVPSELLAMAQNQYVVPGRRPVTAWLY